MGFPDARCNMVSRMKRIRDERVKQVAVGAVILLGLTVVVVSLLTGWRYMPGFLGEWIGTMMGIITTPFFMEASFAILGLVIVILLNHWRMTKDGEELVYLEQVTGPDVPANLPDHAKWAVYREPPLDVVEPSLLAQAEGAYAIGDYSAATEWIGAMDHDELKQTTTLRLRVELAKATGRTDLVEMLENELQQTHSGPI